MLKILVVGESGAQYYDLDSCMQHLLVDAASGIKKLLVYDPTSDIKKLLVYDPTSDIKKLLVCDPTSDTKKLLVYYDPTYFSTRHICLLR